MCGLLYRYSSARLLKLWLNKGSPRHRINGRGVTSPSGFPLPTAANYIPDTKILLAPDINVANSYQSTGSSDALDFNRQFIIGSIIEKMVLLVVLYDEIVGEFDIVNKEHQPRAVTRLNSTSESEKIESHGNHALSNER